MCSPNANALGYYRFDYDTAALHQLGNAVEKQLTPDERIALIGNEWALVRIGKHDVGDYLALGDQLKSTPGSTLLEEYGNRLTFINRYLVNDADRPEFQAWVRNSLAPMMQRLGYTARGSDTPEDRQKRADLFRYLGEVGDDPDVIQQARVMVQKYMQDPTSVDPTLASAVVSVAARHGDAQLYSQYKAQMAKVKSPSLYYRYFYNLADFPGQAEIKETLESTLTPAVRGQDLYILISLLSNPNSQGAAWDFISKNFGQIQKKTGGGLGGVSVFLYGAQSFCSDQRAKDVKQFFAEHSFPGTERNQKETVESINSCVGLRDEQQSKLSAWLRQNGNVNADKGGNSGPVGAMR